MNFKQVKTIFFDYDGTLHDSMAIYEPAFKKAITYLEDQNVITKKDWTGSISQLIGQNPKAMWDQVAPTTLQQYKVAASKRLSQTMHQLIQQGKAQLYEGAIETLEYLKSKGYQLVFISNCKTYYMQAHTQLFNLNHYFDAMVCAEMMDYAPKDVILKNYLKGFPKDYVIIGDRHHDIQAGKANNIATIGCNYGFGKHEEIQSADVIIDDIRELKALF